MSGAMSTGRSVGVDIGHGGIRVAVMGGEGAPIFEQQDTPVDARGPGRGTLDTDAVRGALSARLGNAARVTAAVPQSWLAPGVEGTPLDAHTAGLRALLSSVTKAPVDFVSAPVAALAGLLDGDTISAEGRWVVVADLGITHSEVVLCEFTDNGPRARTWASTGAPDPAHDPLWALAELANPRASHPQLLAFARELLLDLKYGQLRHADAALRHAKEKRAAGDPEVWQDFRLYAQPDLPVGPALDILEKRADVIEAVASRLHRACPETGGAQLVLLGAGACFGPLREALLRGLGRSGPVAGQADGSPEPRPAYDDPVRQHAAARGAALSAAGRITLNDAFRHLLALLVHRRSGTELVERLAPLVADPHTGEAAFVYDPDRDRDAEIELSGSAALALWISRGGTAPFAPLPVDTAGLTLTPGRYRIGLRLDSPATPVLVFARVSDGATVSRPLTEVAPLAMSSSAAPPSPGGSRAGQGL